MATGLPARRVLVCAVLATALTGSLARAERRPVAVIDLSGDPAAKELVTDLNAILTNHSDLRPVNYSFIQTLMGPFVDEERPSLDIARREKQDAEESLVNLDYRAAEAAALRGTQALQNVRPTPEMLGLFAELAFATGQAQLRQKKPIDASLMFALSYRLDPSKRPDPTRYEPEFVDAYTIATNKPSTPATLEVKGDGTVWIDGIDRGAAPGTFDVAAGMHVVQLSGAERDTRGKLVGVTAMTSLEIEAAPASDVRKIERARIELARAKDATARAGAMKKLAQLLGCKTAEPQPTPCENVGDAVLIEKTESGELRVQTWRDRAPGFSATVAIQEGQKGKTGELLKPLEPPKKPEPPKQNPFVVLPVVPVEEPIYRKRWFQGAVAGGIIAVVATIVIIASQDRMVTLDTDVKVGGP